jgi:hypothetical protein
MGSRFCVVAMFVAWKKVQPLAMSVAPLGPRSKVSSPGLSSTSPIGRPEAPTSCRQILRPPAIPLKVPDLWIPISDEPQNLFGGDRGACDSFCVFPACQDSILVGPLLGVEGYTHTVIPD